jgi:hypothetical protein
MFTRLQSICVALVLGVLVWAADAGAQTARGVIRQKLTGEAQLSWDGAIELYEAGDYEGSLVQFKRAYELSRQPQVLFDVGLCLKNMARYAQAIATWETELGFREKLPKVDVQALEAAIETLRPFVSSLSINVNEAGAVISVDGEEVGRSPLVTPVPINVGKRIVRVAKAPDFLTSEHTIEVTKGQTAQLSVTLEPAVKTATVSVTAAGAAGATLFLDGRELGASPFKGAVPTGSHTFVARAAGYREALETIDVVQGEPLNITLSLVPVQNEGKLRVMATPADAQIEIDGKTGVGSFEALLSAGGHQLRVTKPGYESYVQDVSLSPGQDRTLTVELSKSQSWIWWTVSLVAVVGGGAIASAYLLQPNESPAVSGTLFPHVLEWSR